MHGEDLFVDDGSDRQAVEAIRKSLPQLDVVSALALIVEAVNTVDAGTFVVSSQDEEILWIFDLVGKEQADGLEGLFATIHVVSEEEVVRFGREPAVLEQAKKIVVLAVDIATNLPKHESVRASFSHVSPSSRATVIIP